MVHRRLPRPLPATLIALALVAGAIVGYAYLGPGHPDVHNPVRGHGTRIMIVGDSLTQGDAGTYTWRYRLWRHLTRGGTRVDFVGPRTDLYDFVEHTWGDHHYAAPRFDWDHDALAGEPLSQATNAIEQDIRTHRPRYLLVLLGTNDLALFGATTDQLTADLRRFVANARRARPDIRIVLGRIPPMTPNPATGDDIDQRMSAYNTRVTQVAGKLSTARSPIAVAPADRGYDDHRDSWDGTHPNARGEFRIAAAFADALHARFGLGHAYPRPLPDVSVGPATAPHVTARPGDGAVTLSWRPVPGATGYWLWRCEVGVDTGFRRLPTPLNSRAVPWVDRDLAHGVTYVYKVQPIRGRDAGAVSAPVRATTRGSTPPTPRLSVSAGDGRARLTWTATPGVTYWVLLREQGDHGFHRLPYAVAGAPFTIRPLTNGTRYQIRLQPTRGSVDGALTNIGSVTPHR